MQKLKSLKIDLNEIAPGVQRRSLSHAALAEMIEAKYGYLPYPLIISISENEAILEYPV